MVFFKSSRKRSAGMVVLLAAISASAMAGPIGAAGDIYVIGSADYGIPVATTAVIQYDGATGQRVGSFTPLSGGQFNGMVWGPNGNLFTSRMASTGNWQIREFDGQTGAFLQDVITYSVGDFSAAKGMAFGPDGDLYVGDFFKGTVTRYDGTSYAVKATTAPSEIGTPNGMRFAPDGRLLVISGGFNEVRAFDVSTGGVVPTGTFATITGAAQPQDLTFGPHGNLFVSKGAF